MEVSLDKFSFGEEKLGEVLAVCTSMAIVKIA